MTKCWKFHCQGQVHCQGHGQLVATNASRERSFDRQGELFSVLLKLCSCYNVLRAILEQCSSNCPTRHFFIDQHSIGSQWTKSKKLITFSYKWKSCLVQIWSSIAFVWCWPSISFHVPSCSVLPPKNGVQIMIVAFRPYCENLYQMMLVKKWINTYIWIAYTEFFIVVRFVLLCV